MATKFNRTTLLVAKQAWIAGWLFTVGFAQLPFWHALAAVFIWPYYAGDMVRALAVG